MGLRGPAPAPTAIKKARGNPGRRPLNKKEPQPRKGRPKAPAWLTGRAKHWFRSVVKELEAMGVVTMADRDALAAMAYAYDEWKTLALYIRNHGRTYELVTREGGMRTMERPEVKQCQHWHEKFVRLLKEFGLTPSARSRLQVEKEAATDPLEAFMNSKKPRHLRAVGGDE